MDWESAKSGICDEECFLWFQYSKGDYSNHLGKQQGLANGIANSMEIELEKPSLLILFPKCQENLIIQSRVNSTGSVMALHLTELVASSYQLYAQVSTFLLIVN